MAAEKRTPRFRAETAPGETAPSDAAPSANPAPDAKQTPEERFVSDLIIRGEAVEAPDGRLPPAATHEIVGVSEQGQPIVRRRRFTLNS